MTIVVSLVAREQNEESCKASIGRCATDTTTISTAPSKLKVCALFLDNTPHLFRVTSLWFGAAALLVFSRVRPRYVSALCVRFDVFDAIEVRFKANCKGQTGI